jgi:peptidyl-prolyl cis-trans isomerase C
MPLDFAGWQVQEPNPGFRRSGKLVLLSLHFRLTEQTAYMRISTGFFALTAVTAALYGAAIAAADDAAPPQGAPAAAAAAAPAAQPTAVVVTVNGVAITRAELDRATQAFLAQNRMPAPTDPDQKKKMEEAAQEQMVTEEVLYQAAKKEEVPDLDKQVAAKFDEVKAQFPDPEDLAKALKKNGITEQELKDLLQRDVVIGAYIAKQSAAEPAVTTEQAKAFYDENLDKFKKPESVRASHILIKFAPKATDEEKQAARKKADELLAKLKGGADFAEVAKQESADTSAKQGGDLGEFGRGQMVKPFEDAAFGLKPGDLSEVVESQFGYHIIKSTGKTEAQTVPFAEVQAKIVQYLTETQGQKRMAAKIAELKKAATIVPAGQEK